MDPFYCLREPVWRKRGLAAFFLFTVRMTVNPFLK
jgi:hypothetical protein